MNPTDGRILIFSKAPQPGQVKTRLQSLLSPAACGQLQRTLILHTLEKTTACSLIPTELWCSPHHKHSFFQSCAKQFGIQLKDQTSGDLGTRMLVALQQTLQSSTYAILIGSDCPLLDLTHLETAIKLLQNHTVVITPAEDGGYVLLGARQCDAQLFTEIDWGSPLVMTQTEARLNQLGWRWTKTAALWDIDRPQDLLRLRTEKPLLFAQLPAAIRHKIDKEHA